MNCYYCDMIRSVDNGYAGSRARHDLGSAAPRCPKHWRYVCARCARPDHFMRTAFCPTEGSFFCANCALAMEQVPGPFWRWKYHFSYRSPWSGELVAALDRTEFDGTHPLHESETAHQARATISTEEHLVRYPEYPVQWRPQQEFTDADVQANWNTNAERWDAGYDDDGDANRRYQSDGPMLELLGAVHSLRILDVGSGNGYLCRMLARAGAVMTGVELSDRFVEIATGREAEEKLGIAYHNASASAMDFLPPDSPPKIVGMAFVGLQQVWGVNRGVDKALRGVSERIGNG